MPTWTVPVTTTFSGRIEALLTVPAGGAAVSATNSGGGPTTVTVPAADYYLTAAGTIAGLLATLQAQLIASAPPSAGTWTVTLSASTGLVTINCTSGTWSLAWTSTTLRDVLGFTADITSVSAAQTGTKQARGLWIPDCPLFMDGDPYQAPMATDRRGSEAPTGRARAVVGNVKYRHGLIRYSNVPRERTWESAVTYANASWEFFVKECLLGQNSSWFTPSSTVQIYWSNAGVDTLVGGAANGGVGVDGWGVKGITGVEPKQAVQGWTGQFVIEIPELTSDG